MIHLGERIERAAAKGLLAGSLARVGAGIGGIVAGPPGAAVGAGVGAVTGLIVGDEDLTFAIDFVAIPAHEYSMVRMGGAPSQTVYIKAGETLLATGGNVDDVQQGVQEALSTSPGAAQTKPKRKQSAYNRRYSKAFKKVQSKYRKKNGDWMKNGFNRASKHAHRIAGGGK